MAKNNKFEIVAIIREELLRKTKLELKFTDHSLITQLKKVDFDYFTIAYDREIILSSVSGFLLHSENGLIQFTARFSQALTEKLACGLTWHMPEMLFLIQRRQHQRFSLLKGYRFYCSGRYRNGENYALQIKDISRGGCALITSKVNARFLYKSALIKRAQLDFFQLGCLQVDLRIVDVVPVREFDENDQLYACQQISCKFEFKHPREEDAIEKIIMNFLLSNKLKNI